MTRLLLAWLALAAMCTLLVFQVDLHSDLLFLDSVAVDLFHHGGAWSNWKITPAPAYFPDIPAYILAYFVLPTPPARIVFVCMVQACLLAWACLYLARTIKPSFSPNAQLFVLVATAAVVLVAANSSMWLFFNSTNNHFAALVFPLACLAWTLAFLKKKAWPALLPVAGGVAVGTASTSIFLIAFTAPALVFLAGCIVVFRAHRQFRRLAFQVAAAIVAGHVLSILLQKLLLSHNAMEGRALFTLDMTLRSITAFVAATRLTFGTENIYTLSLAIFLVIAMAWVFLDWILSVRVSLAQSPARPAVAELEIPGKNWAYNLSVVFLLVVLPVNVAGAVLSGGFGDPAGYRYFTFPIALGALLWIVMLDFKSVFRSQASALLAGLCMLALAGVGVLSLKPLLLQTQRASYAEVVQKGKRGATDAIGECIDREAKQGFVFGSGIGDFWNARGLSYKTGKPLYILPIHNDGNPFFHMVTLGPLLAPQAYGVKPYNFVVMQKSAFNLLPDTLGRTLPPPARTVTCDNIDAALWLYTDTALDTQVQKNIARFLSLEGLSRHYAAAAHELPGAVGKASAGSRVAEAGTDPAGYLSYGPYIALPPGRYQGVISYTATEPGNKWDVGLFNDPEKLATLAAGEVAPGKGELKFTFETRKKLSSFEIRTWFGGRGTFAIHKIQFQPADSQ